MSRSPRTEAAVLGLVAALLAGCAASPPVPAGRPIDQVYEEIHREGSRDAVRLLREGMASRQLYGYTDPGYPVRTPEIVVAVWVPAYIDPHTDMRVEGHWEHVVVQRGDWAMD